MFFLVSLPQNLLLVRFPCPGRLLLVFLAATIQNSSLILTSLRSQPAAQPCDTGPRKIASHGASLRHSPAARAPGKLPLTEPACGTALRHGPQENCFSRSQPAAQPCGKGPRKIASHGASLRHSPARAQKQIASHQQLFFLVVMVMLMVVL